VVHLLASTLEPPLKGQRILPKVMHQPGKRGRVRRPELGAPCSSRIGDRLQMFCEGLPLPRVTTLQRMRVEDGMFSHQRLLVWVSSH